jgi:hypothetical protein
VRISLIEELTLGGAMTATEVGERIGESPTTCSFHLRQLAKYGFVEEAGGGKGRARPWRMTSIGMSFSNSPDDAETQLATNAVVQLFMERQFRRYQTWLETRHAYPPAWRRAAGDSQYVFYLTADELQGLNDELVEMLLPRYMERITDPARRPAGSVPVAMLLMSFPVGTPPPASEAGGPGPDGRGAAGPGPDGPAESTQAGGATS